MKFAANHPVKELGHEVAALENSRQSLSTAGLKGANMWQDPFRLSHPVSRTMPFPPPGVSFLVCSFFSSFVCIYAYHRDMCGEVYIHTHIHT